MDAEIFGGPGAVVTKKGQRFADLRGLIIWGGRRFALLPQVVGDCGCGYLSDSRAVGKLRQRAADIFRLRAFFLTENADTFAEVFHFPYITRP